MLTSITFSGSFPKNTETILRVGATMVFLGLAIFTRLKKQFLKYWAVSFTFFAVSFALTLQWLLNDDLIIALNLNPFTIEGLAIGKLTESLLRIIPILALLLAARFRPGSLFLAKGRLKNALMIGGGLFFLTAGFGIAATFGSVTVLQERILPALPWLLIYALANAFSDELIFRGVFLDQYQSFLGMHPANLLAAVLFTIAYVQPDSGNPEGLLKLSIMLILGLSFGYLMQKTKTILGAWLFHAGVVIAMLLL